MSLEAEVVVNAVPRDKSVRTKDLRNAGFIPAVIYSKGGEAKEVQIEYQEFRKAFRQTGTSTVLDVKYEGEDIMTLVHDIQYHPVSGNYFHLDLYEVKADEKVSTTLEVIIDGLAPAVKMKSAVLVTSVSYIDIRCFPRDLLPNLRVDVSGLKDYHDTIRISDMPLAQNKDVEVLTDMDTVLAVANPPKGGIAAFEAAAEKEAEESGAAA